MIIKNKFFKYKTEGEFGFIDVTDDIFGFVDESGIQDGFVNIQTLHTTAVVLVNENEPLLIEDMKKSFGRIAEKNIYYGHNDFDVRTVNVCGIDECNNGHSHCLAAYMPTNITLNLIDGKISLGKWQRVFFIELDRCRDREIQVQIMGK